MYITICIFSTLEPINPHQVNPNSDSMDHEFEQDKVFKTILFGDTETLILLHIC
jgi:hypothetical protein